MLHIVYDASSRPHALLSCVIAGQFGTWKLFYNYTEKKQYLNCATVIIVAGCSLSRKGFLNSDCSRYTLQDE